MLRVVAYVGDNRARFKELLKVFATEDYRLCQRAAWPLMHIADKEPALIKPHLTFLVNLLQKPMHDAVKRNVLRILQDTEIPEKLSGRVTDYCFSYMRSLTEPIAVRVFAMTILANMCSTYPELKQELIPLIEDMLPYGSAGMKNRGSKLLVKLRRLPG